MLQLKTVGTTHRWGVLPALLLGWAVLATPALSQQKPTATIPIPGAAPGASAPTEANPAQGTSSSAVETADITYRDGRLSLKAEMTDLAGLLRRIAGTIGIPFEISPDVSGQVTVSFAELSVEEGIKRVLEASGRTNYAAEFKRAESVAKESATLQKIIIASGKRGLMPAQAVAKPGQDLDALFSYVKKTYGWYEKVINEGTGRFRLVKFHEPGISQKINRNNMEAYCRSKVNEFLPFLGLSMEMFRFESVQEDRVLATCVFQQVVNGVPVEGAGMGVIVWKPAPGTNANDLVSFGTGAHPNIKVPTESKITAEEALRIAQEKYRAELKGKRGYVEDDANQRYPSRLVIYPKGDRDEKPTRFDYYLTWYVWLYGARFHIDAVDGQIVSWASTEVQLSGKLSGRRYGSLVGSSYKEDFQTATHEEGLGGLYVWRSSDTALDPDHLTLPALPIVMTSPDEPNKGLYDGIGSGDLPVYMRLDSGWFRIYYKDDKQTPVPPGETDGWTSGLDGADLTGSPFGDSSAEGHRTNIYHQLFRGMKWLFAEGLPHNHPPAGLMVWSSVTDLEGDALGSTADNYRIRLSSKAGLSSDVILHELTHAAVFTNRGTYIGVGKPQDGVSEGLAEFFAARMNNDPIMETDGEPGRIYDHLDGRGEQLEKVEDWTGDGVIDFHDFSHYSNGKAVASALWDLSRSGMPDRTVWYAIQPAVQDGAPMEEGEYAPEALYIALKNFEADSMQLWDAFSVHGINLWGRPGSWQENGLPSDPPDYGAVTLDWFGYLGFSGAADYRVVCNELVAGMEFPVYDYQLSVEHPEWAAGARKSRLIETHPSLVPGKTYRFSIHPCDGQGNVLQDTSKQPLWVPLESNTVDVTVDVAGVPVELGELTIADRDPSSGSVLLAWRWLQPPSNAVTFELDRCRVTTTGCDHDSNAFPLKGKILPPPDGGFFLHWDRDLLDQATYRYSLTSFNVAGRNNTPPVLLDETAVNNPPLPPSGLTGQILDDGKIGLIWHAPALVDIKGYRICRRATDDNGPIPCQTEVRTIGSPGGGDYCVIRDDYVGITYRDESAVSGALYYYAIFTKDNAGGESAPAFFDTAPPSSPSGVYGIVLVNPVTHGDAIALSWDASTDNDRVDHYVIERRFNGGAFVQLDVVNAADGVPRHDRCSCNEGGMIGDARYLYFDSYNNLDCGGLNPGTYTYRITAVDGAGNRSSASQPYPKLLEPLDLVVVVARSARWVHYPTSYPRMVGRLVGSLAEKVPDGSNVAVLLFQKSVVETAEGPFTGIPSLGDDDEARRQWVQSEVNRMLGIPECELLLPDVAKRDLCWRRDYWYLDVAEALTGIAESPPWRQQQLGIPAADGWNARRVREALRPDHRKIAILVSDWYDNSLIAHLNGSEVEEVYREWGSAIEDYTRGGNILKNVILHRTSTPQSWMEDATAYFEKVLHTERAYFVDGSRIPADNIQAMTYTEQENFDNAALDKLIHCRENLLNESYQVQPGERRRIELPVDASVSSIGVLLFGTGLSHRLFRPDGSEVPMVQADGAWVSADPQVVFQRLASGGYDRFGLSHPQAGVWVLEVDGTGLSAPLWGQAQAYATSGVRFSAEAPALVRPGARFAVSALVAGEGPSSEPAEVTFRLLRPGSVFATGQRQRDTKLTAFPSPSSLTAYGHELSLHDFEGRYPYRFLMEGKDADDHLIAREVSGSIFVQGDAPVIATPSPMEEIVEESPRISVLVADDVKVQSCAIRVDGRTLSLTEEQLEPASVAAQFTAPSADWRPRQVKRITGQVTWTLTPGEHTVEVTATDTINQEAAPEIWTFRVAPGLLATDATGDDWGPGYYTYPTNPTLMPRGALDLEGFRVYRDGSLISFNVDLKNYYESYATPTLATLPSVVDVYLDTDGLSGSGRTDLLPGRNALLRAQDGWEYCLSISREGARLISAAGSEAPLTAIFNAGTGTLSVNLALAQLGVSDPRVLGGWGYLVATLGYDGLNAGHVRETTTLGGAHVFGGGAEGSWDPNIIDLLAAGTAQQTMLGSYSVAEGRRAELAAYRFANPPPIDDQRAPVLSALLPTSLAGVNPPQIGYSASDDWALDLGQCRLWLDGAEVAAAGLEVSGNDRLASARHLPGAALAEGRHEVRARVRDQAGNVAEATWEFVVGAAARIATVGGAPRADEMALRGTAAVTGTAAGGTNWRLEWSSDGTSWMQIASGTGSVHAETLGTWATGAADDGDYSLRLAVAGEGWEQTDTVAVQLDNTVPVAGLAALGGAPAPGLLRGAAVVQGWAADEHLASWTLAYGAGEAPTSWTALASGSTGAGAADQPAELGSWNTAALANGTWTLRLLVRDVAGNERDVRLRFEMDNTAPEALIETPAAAAIIPGGSRVSIVGTAYDHHLLGWVLEYGFGSDPPAWQQIGSSTSLANHSQLALWDTAGLAPGVYVLKLTVSDDVGQTTIVQTQLTLSAAPLARIVQVSPQAEGFVRGAVEVRGSAGFAAGGSYALASSADGVAWAAITSGTAPVTDGVLASWDTTAVAAGARTLRLRVAEADATTASDQTAIMVDNTAPAAAILSPAEGAGVGGRVEITGTAADAHLASYTLEWGAGAAPESWTGLGTFSPRAISAGLLALWETRGLEVGPYTLRLRGTDVAGAVTEVLRGVQVTTDSIAPAVALEAPADGTVTSGASLEVRGTVTDAALARWELTAQRFVDGAWGTAQLLASGAANAFGLLHVWDVAALEGRHRLTLTARDTAGNAPSATAEVVLYHAAGYARIEGIGTLSMPFETPLPPFTRGGMGQFVSGAVEVRGSALAPALTSYVLETSADGTAWSEIASGNVAVAHGVLGTWDTTALGDGGHHLRLRVLDAAAAEASDATLVPLDNLPPSVAITAPADGGLIGGYQYILGTAADAHFGSYELEIASATTPGQWSPIGGRGYPVTAGNLGTWVVNGDVGPYKQLYAVAGNDDFLSFVQDIEVAADGRVFALDYLHERVRVFDQQGRYLYSIGGGGELTYALGLYLAGDELFVANSGVYGGANAVYVYSLDGMLRTAVPVSAVPADAPFDVAVDATGLIYTTCESTAAVLVYTRAGELVRTLAPTIDGRQVSYRSIDLDAAGNIYLSAPVLGKTVKLSPEGEYLQGFGKANLGAGGNLSSFISGGQVDGQGQVYLADRLSGLVYQFDAAGTWIGVTGPFSIPDCIKVDDEGLLYVGMPFGAGFVALAPSTPVEAAALPEGPYSLRLVANDRAGHRAAQSVQIEVERRAPEAEITAPAPGATVSGIVQIQGTARDEHFARYELWRASPRQVRDPVTLSWSEVLENKMLIGPAQTTAVESGPLGAWDTAQVPSGVHALLLRVYDAAGNMSEARADVILGAASETIAVSVAAPAANAALVAGAAVDVRGSIAISGGVLDRYVVGYGQGAAPQEWVEISRGYTAPAGAATLCSWDTTGLVQGDYTLLVRAVTLTGREAETRVPVRVSAGPVVAVMSPVQGGAVAGVAEVLGTVWDEDLVGYTLERGAGASPTVWEQIASSSQPVVSGVLFHWDTAGMNGQYSFRLRAWDAAGNESLLVRQVAADNTRPLASLRAEINYGGYGVRAAEALLRTDSGWLRGSVSDQNLRAWRLEYGEGYAPASWSVHSSGIAPVTDAKLAALSGSTLPWSIVTYALVVEDRAGNSSRAEVTLRRIEMEEFAPGVVSTPVSAAVSPQGRLYVLDATDSRVAILDAESGALLGRFGGSGTADGLFTVPTDVATDAAGNVYVLEWAGRLQRFDADGVFLGSLAARGSGLTVGADGTLCVTGKPPGEQYHVRLHDAAGNLVRAFGEDGSGPGLFDSFSDFSQKIARDRFGNLYVSNGDRGAEIFDPEGRLVMEVQYLPGVTGHRYANGIGVDDNGNLALTLGYQRALWKTHLDGRWLWYGRTSLEQPGDLEISPWGTFVCATRLWRFVEPVAAPVAAPVARIDAPADGATANGEYVAVLGSAAAPGFVEYRLAWAPAAASGAYTEIVASDAPVREGTLGFWRVAELPEGAYLLRLTLRDAAGGTETRISEVTLDRTAPALATIEAPADLELVAGTVNVVGSAWDERFDRYRLERSSGTGWSLIREATAPVPGGVLGSFDTATLSGGTYRLRLRVFDRAGNVAEAQRVVSVGALRYLAAIGGISSEFAWSQDVAVDSAGQIYVSIGPEIRVYGPDGAHLRDIGGFGYARGLSIDGQDRLTVADDGGVTVLDAAGNILLRFGSPGGGPGQFDMPHCALRTASGRIYVSDSRNHRVQVFDATGAFLFSFGSQGSAPGQFWFPLGLAEDGAGNIYVADSRNARVQVFDSGGGLLRSFGSAGEGAGQFAAPVDLFVDADGFVTVLDYGFGRLVGFNPDGSAAFRFGWSGSTEGAFLQPNGLAYRGGIFYVCDTYNRRVQMLERHFGTVDATPPSVVISSPDAGWTNTATPLLSYTVSDGSVVVRLDGVPIAQRSGDALGPLADGEHLLRVEATDAAGNVGAAEVAFTVDTTPPIVPGEKTLTFTVDAGGGTPIVGATAYLFSATGSYLGLSRMTDAAGQAVYPVEAGSYKIRCDYLGYQFWSEAIALEADATLALTILHRGVEIAVSGAYAGDMIARANVPVSLFTEAGSYLGRSELTDAAGRVGFTLPERGYKVRADYLGAQYWSEILVGAGAAIVIPEALAQVTVSRAGSPLPAVPVSVFGATGAYLGLSGTSDAAGRVEFRLPARAHRFRADYLGAQYFSAQVSLLADAVNPIPITTGGGAVQLTVTNASAGAVAGASCHLCNGDGAYLNLSRSTDAAGQVRFELADGSYRIRVEYLGGTFWSEPFVVPGVAALALDLGGGSLSVAVDRGDGTPISGAVVYLFDGAGTYLGLSQPTDAAGLTGFAVPGGTYAVRCDYLGYQFWSGQIAVSADTALGLSIPHRQVVATVLGDFAGDTEPMAGLVVHLFTPAGEYLGRTQVTDAEGRVRFDLPSRDYRLRADDLGSAYWSEIVQGDQTRIAIPEAIAEIEVTQAAQPLAGVPVHVFAPAGTYLNVSAISDAAGLALFRLPAQAFRFRADGEAGRFFSADALLTAHQTLRVPLSLGGGLLTLTLDDGSGPLAGVPCYLFDGADTYLGASRVSDAAGQVSFDLPDGLYRVRADHLGAQFWSELIAVPETRVGSLSIPHQEVTVAVRRAYDGDVQPVGNAPVHLFAPAGAYLGESRLTDAAGEARFSVPAQSYAVRADYLGRAYWSEPFVWEARLLTIAEGVAEVTVTQAGAPLGGVTVYVFDEQGTDLGIAQQTPAGGAASLRLPAGGQRFAADVQGSRFFGSGVVTADQTTQIELATGGGPFALTVDDGEGASLADLPVYVFGATGAYLGMQQYTDALGRAAFVLSDGEYRLRVEKLGQQFWTPVQTVPAQASALLSIPHGRARVHVSAAGADLAGIPVYVFSAAGTYLEVSATTDASGIAEVRLPAGDYAFRADAQSAQHWSPALTLVAGELRAVEIAVAP